MQQSLGIAAPEIHPIRPKNQMHAGRKPGYKGGSMHAAANDFKAVKPACREVRTEAFLRFGGKQFSVINDVCERKHTLIIAPPLGIFNKKGYYMNGIQRNPRAHYRRMEKGGVRFDA